MTGCIHHIDMCPDCDGLRVTRLDLIGTATDFTLDLDDGTTISSGPATLYIGPVATPCDKPTTDTQESA